jgi:hypothetical protein
MLDFISQGLATKYTLENIKEQNTKWKADVFDSAGKLVMQNFEVYKAVPLNSEKSHLKQAFNLLDKSVLIRDWK